MKVKEILEHKGSHVWTVPSKATIREALGILVNQRIGALVALDDKGEIEGMLSERDIIRECYHQSKHADTTYVHDVMTSKIIVGHLDDNIDYIMGIMTHNRIRHIPIVHGKKLEGMISIGDVVKAQLSEKEYENRYLKDYMFGSQAGS